MVKIIKKIKNKGFALLFAVTISSIILAITLGITNIAYKELKFGTDARGTNDAFFAADTGAERALFMDKVPPGSICTPAPCNFNFIIPQIGSSGQSCVNVTVTKAGSPVVTTIVAKGYNIGNGACLPNPDRIERELRVTY